MYWLDKFAGDIYVITCSLEMVSFTKIAIDTCEKWHRFQIDI